MATWYSNYIPVNGRCLKVVIKITLRLIKNFEQHYLLSMPPDAICLTHKFMEKIPSKDKSASIYLFGFTCFAFHWMKNRFACLVIQEVSHTTVILPLMKYMLTFFSLSLKTCIWSSFSRLLDITHGHRRDREMSLHLIFEHIHQDLSTYIEKCPAPGLSNEKIKVKIIFHNTANRLRLKYVTAN